MSVPWGLERSARPQVEAGVNVLGVCASDGMLDSGAATRRFPNLLSGDPDVAPLPVRVESSGRNVIRIPAATIRRR